MTAALGLYRSLELPQPWAPAKTRVPILIYGASSAVGAFAIKLARLSKLHPIIAIAGRGCSYVESLIDRMQGDVVIDYRSGREALSKQVRTALADVPLHSALDAISEGESFDTIKELLAEDANVAVTLPPPGGLEDNGVHWDLVMSGDVHGVFEEKAGAREFGCVMMQAFARSMEAGMFKGHPFKVVAGGLGGIQQALEDLKAGKASAVKYVIRIEDTL